MELINFLLFIDYKNGKIMIHIVCTTDTNYVMPTGVMIKSLSVNNNEEQIVFHIVIDGSVTSEQRKELEEVIGENDRHSLFFHFINGRLFDDFPQLGTFNPKLFITKATYYRLLFTEILPDDINKVIYLDCDMIIMGSLLELWNTDVSHCALAAVTDMSESIHDFDRLGYNKKLGYFNAGLLLINLAYWRKINAKSLFWDLIKRSPERIKFHDQDVLNICFKANKKMLSFKWNFQDGFIYKPELMEMDENKYHQQLEEARKNPVIIHYTSMAKPWHVECQNPYKKEFFKYLKQTHWRTYRLKRRFEYNAWRHLFGDVLRALHLREPIEKQNYPYSI